MSAVISTEEAPKLADAGDLYGALTRAARAFVERHHPGAPYCSLVVPAGRGLPDTVLSLPIHPEPFSRPAVS